MSSKQTATDKHIDEQQLCWHAKQHEMALEIDLTVRCLITVAAVTSTGQATPAVPSATALTLQQHNQVTEEGGLQ